MLYTMESRLLPVLYKYNAYFGFIPGTEARFVLE